MSREIKFRAWDIKNKRFVNIVSIVLDQFGALDYVDVVYKGKIYKLYPSEVVLEQYTGLKDKNGKEIYEGDILWWEHFYGMTGENIETTAKVYWEEKDASFVVGDWFEPLGHLLDEDEIEVIGNIHENPELLGDKE